MVGKYASVIGHRTVMGIEKAITKAKKRSMLDERVYKIPAIQIRIAHKMVLNERVR